jgi:hypothetical protein
MKIRVLKAIKTSPNNIMPIYAVISKLPISANSQRILHFNRYPSRFWVVGRTQEVKTEDCAMPSTGMSFDVRERAEIEDPPY